MSDNEKNEDDNGQDEGSINVFDDNAYMFGDDPSGNNLEEQNEINDENPINQKEIENNDKEEYDNNLNEEINNMESKDSLRKYLEQQMQHDQIQNNDNNININENSIKNKLTTNEENISQKIQNSKNENDINDVGVTKKSEKNIQKELLNNNQQQNEEYEGEEQEQENYVGEEEEVENGEVEDIEGEGEGEAEEENIPLVTLKFISICQFCKNNFNSTIHLPYLLKCGHFFCLKCIKENFTDEEGIKCPNDGLIAYSIKELKLIGRKRKGDNKEGKHNKNDSDNIIKKCKAVLFKYIIIYVLDIVNKLRTNKEENFELLKLSYKKYIDKLKKKNELDLFKMKIKNLVSLETSSKYSINKDKDFNKKSINKILEEEKDNKVLINLLNLSFGDWIDIFTLKDNIENSFKFNGLEEALKDISDKNEEEYFSRFIFYLFNYQNYFYNKKGRRPKTNKYN